jgi:putative DNA primase/helicase
MQLKGNRPHNQWGHNSYTTDYSKKQKYTPEDITRIATALGKPKQYRGGYMCCCPVHEDHEPSLAIWTSESYPLGLKCYANCNPKDILEAIKTRGLLPSHQLGYHAYKSPVRRLGDVMPSIVQTFTPEQSQTTEQVDKKGIAKNMWHEAINPIGTPVETYLQSRGICGDIPPTIRYLPHALHAPTKVYYPCMLSAITRWPHDDVIAVHRTYLSYDRQGKASIEPRKMMLGAVSGGAVQLLPFSNQGTLYIGEGIETMLSIKEAYSDCAILAVLSSSNYKGLILPKLPLASTIIICADNDANGVGLKTAQLAAKKWQIQGRTIKIVCPLEKGADFNDVLLMGDLV